MSLIGQRFLKIVKKQGSYLAWLFVYDPLFDRFSRWIRQSVATKWFRSVLAVSAGFCLFSLTAPKTANALWGWVEEALGYVLLFFYSLAAEILRLTGLVFNKVIESDLFNQIITAPAVEIGWTTTRDICNIVFILILLGIGFATILRVPTYHVKKLIVPFIVALLLINFSKLICGVVTDFCHVIMASFVAAINGDNYSGAILSAVGVGSWTRPPDGFTGVLIPLAITTIFMIALSFALLLLAALLVSRWITLLVLTIFSPLVYAAQILPTTKGFAKKWWQQFLQTAFYGPAAVFMVYLAISIVTEMSMRLRTELGTTGDTSSASLNWGTMVALLIACILLYKAVTFSKNLGIAGAGAVVGTAEKWGKKGFGAVTGGAAKLTAKGVGAAAGWAGSRAADRLKRTGLGGKVSEGISGLRSKVSWSRLGKAKLDQSRGKAEKAAAESLSMAGAKDSDLSDWAKKGTASQRVSALSELAKRGKSKEIKDAMGGWDKAAKFMDQYGSGQSSATFRDAWKKADPWGATSGDPKQVEKVKRHIQTKGLKDIDTASFHDSPEFAKLVASSASTRSIRDLTDEQRDEYAKSLSQAVPKDAQEQIAIDKHRAVAQGDLSGIDVTRHQAALNTMSPDDIASLNASKIQPGTDQHTSLENHFLNNPGALTSVQRQNPQMSGSITGALSAKAKMISPAVAQRTQDEADFMNKFDKMRAIPTLGL